MRTLTRKPFSGSLRARRRCLLTASPATATPAQIQAAEADVLEAISDVTGRGKEGITAEQQALLDSAVQTLEADGGVPDPTASDILNGRWRLLYTSRPGSASPIQRTFTGVEAFKIFQEVRLDAPAACRVNNIVEFGSEARWGVLKVEAEGSTDARPLAGFTPRKGAGLFLFGKSQTGPPARKNMRVDFQFDRAAFNFRFLPFKVPYPVPFKYLGDETKGWIDVTYMNAAGTLRLTRGNKGTLFVLAKDTDDVDDLLVAIREKDESTILQLIDKLGAAFTNQAPSRDANIQGKWRLVWSQQADSANPLQKALAGRVKNWQIIEGGAEGEGTLENRVDLGLGVVRAIAACSPLNDRRTKVIISETFVEAAGRRFDFNAPRDGAGFVEWLHVDGRIRITKGSKGSYFIHVREPES